MNVIVDASNDQRRAFKVVENPRLVGPQAFLNTLRNPWPSFLGAVHEVNQIFDQGLWHRLFVLCCRVIVPPRWGLGFVVVLFPGALPQADMWLPRWGKIAIGVLGPTVMCPPRVC